MKFLILLFSAFVLNNSAKATVINDSTKIVSLFKLALQNPAKSDSLNTLAKQLISKSNNNLLLNDTYHYNLSVFLFQTAQLDSALKIAKNGLLINTKDSIENYKSFKFHNILGSIYVYKNKHKQSVIEFQKTIKILENHGNFHQAAIIKNNLANVFFSLHDYETAYKYSKESYTVLKAENDTVYLPSFTGVFATSAIKLKHFKEADDLANESLYLSKKYNNVLGLIVANYCLGDVEREKYNFIESINYYLKSLEISTTVGHQHFITLNKIGLLDANVKTKNYNSAIIYGEEALLESLEQKNENTLYSIHKNLGYAYFGIKNYEKAYFHINESHNLYLKTATLENKEALNNILIKYDTEKKEKELTEIKLSQAQDEIKLNRRKLWIIGLGALLLLSLISYYFYNKNQKIKLQNLQKNQEQKRILALVEGEEKERERLSNELHDGIASSISAIKIQLEHLNSKSPNQNITTLTEQLTNLHEDTRRLSHNLMPITLQDVGLINALSNYCIENDSENLKINYINMINQPIEIDKHTSTILYRIVQELINNVKKHSKSKVCFIQTSMHNNQFTISVEDEGIGFILDDNTSSQGLKSIKKRLNNLGGGFTIDSKIGEGTLVIINITL